MDTPAYTDNNSLVGADSDDDFDWEEVEVPQQPDRALDLSLETFDVEEGPSNPTRPTIEITISTKPKKDEEARKRAARIQAERVARLNCHKMHTIALLVNGRVRNDWVNDELLHARLLSLIPLSIQNGFAMIHKSRVPDAVKRARLFESAITRLVEWWTGFFEVEPVGHIRSRTFEEVQKQLASDPKGKGKASDLDEEEGEVIRSAKSLMKHALMKRGSRDTSAQLFTAACRALGIPSRLVVSLQSVPWKAGVGKPKAPTKRKKATPKGKSKEADKGDSDDDDDMDMEEVSIPEASFPATTSKGEGKAAAFPLGGQRSDGADTPLKAKAPPVIKLRKTKGQKLGSESAERPPRRESTPDPVSTPPVFWTEVFSRADGRWIPVDPIRAIVNKRKAFDPTPNPNSQIKPDRNVRVENRMVYVVAFEEDGYARDVTPRYAREFGAKVAKMQQGGKGRQQWWEQIMGMVHRPYRLNRDDVEDDELHMNQMTEQMPTSMAGFKDHPLYVLERHLKRDEVVYPLTELGKFRGEPVYPRANVLSLKTAENWMRQGRKVREGCQPMKMVKQHAVTVNRQRAIELAMSDRLDLAGEKSSFGVEREAATQGLYAQNQTELYIPNPIVDGKIPKNDFGNVDLYTPSMLPAGAAHIPYKGVAKVARQLGFDYAEAVTGFEFKKRRAFPVLEGIVVASEHEQTIIEAYWEMEHEAEKKRHAKRQVEVIKRWTRLIQGLRIRDRLLKEYGDRQPTSFVNDVKAVDADDVQLEEDAPAAPGGFLTSADDVVQAYTLPRSVYAAPGSPTSLQIPERLAKADDQPNAVIDQPDDLEIIPDSEGEDDLQEIDIPSVELVRVGTNGAPKTMRELAEAAEREQVDDGLSDEVEIIPTLNVAQRAIEKASGNNTPSPRGRSRKGATTPTTSTPKKSANGRASTRVRKRARDEVESQGQPSDEEESAPPTPSKRARSRAAPATPVIEKSDRVLRSRRGKSETKLAEEKELEKAYRRAIAE